MIIKTSELEGVALDWAVAKAIGADIDNELTHSRKVWAEWGDLSIPEHFSPSQSWGQGGPLIAEKVTVTVDTENGCYADCGAQAHAVKHQKPLDEYDGSGPTILIACMRAIVSSELGETVDVPEELVK